MIVDRPESKKTTSAAARAASEAPSTAIPQLAAAREGASLTPNQNYNNDLYFESIMRTIPGHSR